MMPRPYRILLAAALALPAVASAGVALEHQGKWLGELHSPDGRVLKSGVEFVTRADGSLGAGVSAPDHDLYGLPPTSVRDGADTVVIESGLGNFTLHWAADHFEGQYQQHGAPLALQLYAADAFPRKARPQTPQAPFPYRDEAMTIAGPDGITLSATLSVPEAGASTAVVLVHGSGPADRNGDVAGHQPLAVLGDYLARRGTAVLRYDKRGIGRSTGNFAEHAQADLVADLRAVLAALRARGGFVRVGTVGVSEGPVLMAAVAADDPASTDFLVSLAGPGLHGFPGLLLQDRLALIDNGATPGELKRLMRYVRKFYGIVVAEPESAARVARLKALYEAQTASDKALIARRHANVGTLSLEWAAMPFVRAGLLSDPPSNWRRVRVPVLALNGAMDQQVPGKENLAGIVHALHAGGNRQVQAVLLPSLNHLFQTAASRNPDDYAGIAETMAPAALARIAGFIAERERAPTPRLPPARMRRPSPRLPAAAPGTRPPPAG